MSQQRPVRGDYYTHSQAWHVEDAPWKAHQVLRIITQNRLAPTSIGEIGCGPGEVLLHLYRSLPPIVTFNGYEVAPVAYRLAQTRNRDRLRFHLADLLDDEDAFFDVVLALDVLEHVEDYYDFLRRLRVRGTYKIFHIPLDLSAQTVLRGGLLLKKRAQVGHLQYFTRETALAALADTGYQVLDSFYTAWGIELPVRSLAAAVARFPRQFLHALNKDLAARLLGGYSLLVLAK